MTTFHWSLAVFLISLAGVFIVMLFAGDDE